MMKLLALAVLLGGVPWGAIGNSMSPNMGVLGVVVQLLGVALAFTLWIWSRSR